MDLDIGRGPRPLAWSGPRSTEPPGLRLLMAQFTASNGDKRMLAPAKRAGLEAVGQRLARAQCHILT